MNTTLRALAAVLSYPDEDLVSHLEEVRPYLKGVDALIDELSSKDLYTLEEQYVALFDRSRALSLHLFEHVHGESRDRGQAMVDLQAMYAARGLAAAQGELPDFIPAFLEYVSLLDGDEAEKLLAETAHIFRALGERLAERGSRYALVFGALLELAGEAGLSKAIRNLDLGEDRAALDKEWMDPEVTFGPTPGAAPLRFYKKGAAA